MATQWISPTWRMPENSNQNKVDNYSLDFDGTDDFIDVVDVNLGVNSSIILWFNPSSIGPSDYVLLGEGANGFGYTVRRQSGAFYVWVSSTFYNFGSTITNNIVNDEWNFLAIVKNAGTIDVNLISSSGAVVATQTESGWASANMTFDRIGARTYGPPVNLPFEGKIGQVAGFDSILTSDQITALYNSGTPVNPMALTPLPIAYYPLGEGSTGSSTTLTVPNESVPSATVFDFDTADYVSIPHISVSSAFSVSAWVKTTDAGTYGNIFSSDEAPTGGTTRNWQVIRWNAAARFILRDSGGSAIADINGGTINDGNWHHILATWDGTTGTNKVQIYVDGTSVAQGTASSTALANSAIPMVMSGSSATWDFIGDLSNIVIWSSDQSTNIVNIYNNGVPQSTYTTTPTAWYKLNVDTSTWDGTNWIIGNSTANYTTALDFPGATQRIGLASAADLGINSTISVWLNTDQTFGLVNDIVLGYDAEYPLYINNNLINVNIAGVLKSFTPNSMVKERWYNITIVRTGDSVEVFQDGQSLGTQTGYGTAVNTYLNYIGSRQSGGFAFDGKLSNVSVFNSSLSSAQVETIYNNGTPEVSISNSPTGWWKLDNITTGIQDSVGSNNGTITGSVTQVDSFVSTLNGLSDSMTTASLVTSDLTRSIPYSSYSMTFDGAADYISVSDVSNIATNTQGSISFWINFAGDSSTRYAFSVSDTNADTFLTIGIDSSENLDIILRETTTPNLWRLQTTGNPIVLNTWQHVCLTQNGTACEVYVDGAKPTQSGAGTEWLNDLSGLDLLTIGALYKNSALVNPIEGKISNVSVFNTALSEDQIITIYNGGVPNSISSLSPINWWSLAGDSYYDGSNWICPDLGSGGNNGTSTGMGGTELVGDGPGSTANGVATSMDIPANLKGDAPNSTSNAFSINMTAIDRIEYDADAKAFINAAGITDATQQLAIKTLVSSLQNDNLWTNMKAIYPMVGGTATTHMYNLKDPQDTDAAFRLTFAGGWTHSTTGATPNGTNAIGNSHIVLNDIISSVNAMSYGYYSRDTSDVASLSYEMGTYQAGAISVMLINYLSSWYYQVNDGNYETIANSNTDGFFAVNRSGASALEAYRNGSLYDTENSPSNSLSTLNFGIGGIYGANGWSSKECAFAFIYDGSLDATENSNLYNAVQAFNTTLSRQV
jgi:hypothetical protein